MIKVHPGGSNFDEMVFRVNHFMDRMMQQKFYGFRPCSEWEPPMNFYETADAYQVCMDLAGIDPKQAELHLENDLLHIVGHRATPSPAGSSSARIHVMEIDHGPFSRTIKVPDDVETSGIEASYEKGYLWIRLPKR